MPHVAKIVRSIAALTVLLALAAADSRLSAASPAPRPKLDRLLRQRATSGTGHSRVIVRLATSAPRGIGAALIQQLGGTPGRALPIVNAQVGSLPNAALAGLAASPFVEHVSLDRVVSGTMERTAAVIGAAPLRASHGLDGSGIGVAIVDSGITGWHDDLTGAPDRAQRVDRFVDFIQQREVAYDDYGHGTHVAGIVAGNGFDSNGARTGIAPGARLIVLKALDDAGSGRVSDVIAALDYVLANKDALNIRVVNLSVTAPAYESYEIDPLTRAAKRLVTAGLVVVASAGNSGRSAAGAPLYGAIGAPGNAPWVLTVGASSHQGTVDRADDSVAAFSSRGPAAGGYAAKPDLVAPGVGIESLSNPDSVLYGVRAAFLLNGSVPTAYLPYLSLSGTSMSAPVVSGTIALMLQANPALTPNQVKAILQYTAQVYPGYDTLTQGAGFLDAKGAVELAQHFVNPSGAPFPSDESWSRRLIWGNHLVQGGRLHSDANAWSTLVTWGETATADGKPISFGVADTAAAPESAGVAEQEWAVSTLAENVVWGMSCGGRDCATSWDAAAVLGTESGDTVVWGMNDTDTVVWGMSCVETDCRPVLWGDR